MGLNSDFSDSNSENDVQINKLYSRKNVDIILRPNASPGYWLCCLLPLAFATQYLQPQSICSPPSTYKRLAIASFGMCIESLCFFAYVNLKTGLLLKLIISFVPAGITALFYIYLLHHTWLYGLFCGFVVTFFYQNTYIRVLKRLPCCFTYGEAALLVQGVMLFFWNAMLQLPSMLLAASGSPLQEQDEFNDINAIMIFALSCLLIACFLLASLQHLRKPLAFYSLMVLLVFAVTCTPITHQLPVLTVIDFILRDGKRVNIILFYLLLVGFTIAIIHWQLRSDEKASTRMRKIFHLLIVLVYIPGLLYQCTLLYIGTGIALAIFSVVELFRILAIPPLADSLKSAFASFSDEKDAGLLALTPFSLLIGCSLPLWITCCPCSISNINSSDTNVLKLMSGILTVGFGDTAASVVGSKIGYTKWRNSSRSLEGTAAYVIAIILAILCLNLLDFIPMTSSKWLITIVATLISAIVEAHTDQIDNLVLPLIFYTIISFI